MSYNWGQIMAAALSNPEQSLQRASNRFATAEHGGQGFGKAVNAFLTPQTHYGVNDVLHIPTVQASPGLPSMPGTQPQTQGQPQTPTWQMLGYPSQDAYNADNGIQSSSGYVDPGLFANSQGTSLSQLAQMAPYTSKPSAQAGAGPTAPQGNNYTFFNGHGYNLGDPNQGKQYYSDRSNYIDQMAQHQYAPIANQVQTALGQGATQYGEQLAAIKRDLGNLGDQYGAYNHNYNEGITNANQNYDLGAVNRQNMFAQASPNAFQSSQASGEQYARQMLDRELGDMAQNKSLTDKNYNQQEAGLNQQQGDLGTNYNLFTQQNQNALNQYKTNLNDYYGALKDQLGTSAIQSYGGAAPNASQFNYTAQTGQPLQAVNTDISQYTPAINFQGLQGGPAANYFGNFQPQVTQPALSPLQQNLGQVPTQQDKNYIQQFLRS